MSDTTLKKEFQSKDIQRMRNIISKRYGDRTSIGIGYTKQEVKHQEGEQWEEDGKIWIIKNGIRQNVSRLDLKKELSYVPLVCTCGTSLNHWLHLKMYKLHNMCYNCLTDYESVLKKIGKYDEYEKAVYSNNLNDHLKNIESFIKELVNSNDTYVTEQGDVEFWGNLSSKYKEDILKKLENYINRNKPT